MADKARLDPEQVEQFVGVAHGDFAKVQELLQSEPALINAAWDWGGGDWETALGAAAHMGRKDIARHLLAHGARMDIFAAAMLDKVEIVQALIADDPALSHAAGPHGIPLPAHAQAGQAQAVIAYLASLPAA
jgi:hypothetical protein